MSCLPHDETGGEQHIISVVETLHCYHGDLFSRPHTNYAAPPNLGSLRSPLMPQRSQTDKICPPPAAKLFVRRRSRVASTQSASSFSALAAPFLPLRPGVPPTGFEFSHNCAPYLLRSGLPRVASLLSARFPYRPSSRPQKESCTIRSCTCSRQRER